MLFAVLLRDDPERLHLRQSHVEEHLAYVAAQDGRIIAGGALRLPEDAPQGALWLVHADTKEAAQALVVWSEPFAECMGVVLGTETTA